MSIIKRWLGHCFICKTEQEIRNIDLYVIGSEGLNLCHPCEMNLIEHIRSLAGQATEKKKQDFLAKRKEEGKQKVRELILGAIDKKWEEIKNPTNK
jgi:hypothetical protein